VALVDAFDFPDYVLDSALGSYDGQAYKLLWQQALRAPPINATRDGTLRPSEQTPFGYEVSIAAHKMNTLTYQYTGIYSSNTQTSR
jgi:hypothetical protein